MNTDRKNFIPRNEGFVCANCATDVPPAPGTFRNHCPTCLTSKHVDDTTPGDRAAKCHGLMPATAVEGTDPDKLDIVHQCQQCGKVMRNKISADDNKEALFRLLE